MIETVIETSKAELVSKYLSRIASSLQIMDCFCCLFEGRWTSASGKIHETLTRAFTFQLLPRFETEASESVAPNITQSSNSAFDILSRFYEYFIIYIISPIETRGTIEMTTNLIPSS